LQQFGRSQPELARHSGKAAEKFRETYPDPVLRQDAVVSAQINFRQLDKAPEDVPNRILWRAMRGPQAAYPEWAITAGSDDDE